ncbi:MAG: hypothetical protein H6R06_3180 [Proteobacteria bacterium]|jgi:uncharacterized protein|nr:hypothetical protein [Pseudomonadota bacterium]
MTRRRLIALALAAPLLATLGRTRAAGPAPKETSWEELMPKDWDPMKDLRMGDAGLVPEGSVKERNLMRQMREVWDNAPTNPKIDGALVRLPGYVVPLEEVKGELQEFLLVPYFGACIHSPPPPANQIVHVRASTPLKGWRTMDAVWVNGTLKATRSDSAMGASGYSIDDPVVERYVPKPRP